MGSAHFGFAQSDGDDWVVASRRAEIRRNGDSVARGDISFCPAHNGGVYEVDNWMRRGGF